jgi:hypothetical protein
MSVSILIRVPPTIPVSGDRTIPLKTKKRAICRERRELSEMQNKFSELNCGELLW